MMGKLKFLLFGVFLVTFFEISLSQDGKLNDESNFDVPENNLSLLTTGASVHSDTLGNAPNLLPDLDDLFLEESNEKSVPETNKKEPPSNDSEKNKFSDHDNVIDKSLPDIDELFNGDATDLKDQSTNTNKNEKSKEINVSNVKDNDSVEVKIPEVDRKKISDMDFKEDNEKQEKENKDTDNQVEEDEDDEAYTDINDEVEDKKTEYIDREGEKVNEDDERPEEVEPESHDADENYDTDKWSKSGEDKKGADKVEDVADDFEVDEIMKNSQNADVSRHPTAPSSMVLLYTWMIVAVLIVVVGISTYQSRCKGLKIPFFSKKTCHGDDKKRLLDHEFV